MSSQAEFPFEIKPLDKDINGQLLRDFRGEPRGYCQIGPTKWLLPTPFEKGAGDYFNMNLNEDDLFLVGFPRSGSTMTQELVWLVNNDLDYEKAKNIPLDARFTYLEAPSVLDDQTRRDIHQIDETLHKYSKDVNELLAMTSRPRHIKTHLPLSLLPPNLVDSCKIIYVARHPKDVVVSLYHHNRLHRNRDYVNDFPQFWKHFKNGHVLFTPFWPHVEEAWRHRYHPNLLFLYYEGIVKDMRSAIVKVANFLNKSITESDIDRLIDHLKIDNFRKNPSVNRDFLKPSGFVKSNVQPFIRIGVVRGNKEEWADEELSKEADQWVLENVTKFGLDDFLIT